MARVGITFRIIKRSIGDKGTNRHIDIKHIQQLLLMANQSAGTKFIDRRRVPKRLGKWDKRTRDALVSWSQQYGQERSDLVGPDDPALFHLAFDAGVLMPLMNENNSVRGIEAFRRAQSWIKTRNPIYGWKHLLKNVHNHYVWGLYGHPDYAIQTLTGAPYYFDMEHPLTLNCTNYANMMFSLWVRGDLHGATYDVAQFPSGGYHRLAFERYRFPKMGVHNIKTMTPDMFERNRLYSLEICNKSGSGRHQMMLLNGTLYQSNVTRPNWISEMDFWRVVDRKKRLGQRRYYTICGPAPN